MPVSRELIEETPKFGHPMFHQIVEEIRDLHEKKNKQYATTDDPLGNFRRTGQIIAKMLKPGIDPGLASCLAFMSKQVDGVYEMFGESKTGTCEQIEDKLLDIAVYAIIGMILVRESNQRGLSRNLLLSSAQAARYLGVCPSTVRKMYYEGHLRAIRFSKFLWYDVRDIDAWIERQKATAA